MKASLFILSVLSIFACYAAADCCYTSRDNVRMFRGPYSPFKFLFSLVFKYRCAKMESQGNHTAESEIATSLAVIVKEDVASLTGITKAAQRWAVWWLPPGVCEQLIIFCVILVLYLRDLIWNSLQGPWSCFGIVSLGVVGFC
ncbi:hypothetical protein H112_03376 [Trichophyton rubrum D6]|uniref:Uncharacterized protein n=2 Tax=Trichophyton TaxID=5550 RepID=A0A022W5V7_TRIRU|nr:hypothetical protein H100_03379 [Trichophyton rubrum MR850]EZF43081.1 hypothetical protein H102_03375 [Trichophyton rubrum CBS 100081]EZF53722.1 hypothetical protein H103_03386 [Trichophyton rubrum CBS 288.86]EZF64344.1 hypothetical protein H104_03369 [Trichophyton rubrum CBS 289.86]EZF74963.1 hypothetical protein H105_03393 [Trichophyton soudanense CBS 452.61]EZF85638.1 hypothetical protein H110_03381 [Trichophyton rubrum MR1448]EZG17956.1 hypothetical protein H107_03490 [Trichophyton rub